jgi:hypothetical protein
MIALRYRRSAMATRSLEEVMEKVETREPRKLLVRKLENLETTLIITDPGGGGGGGGCRDATCG